MAACDTELGDKVKLPAARPLVSALPKRWIELPLSITGTTVTERCDMLAQLLRQANTHPHPLYNSGTTLRVGRSVHPHRHDARAGAMERAQPVPTALNTVQLATQSKPMYVRTSLFIQDGRLLMHGVAGWSEDAETACPLCLLACRTGALTKHTVLSCEALHWLHSTRSCSRPAPQQRRSRQPASRFHSPQPWCDLCMHQHRQPLQCHMRIDWPSPGCCCVQSGLRTNRVSSTWVSTNQLHSPAAARQRSARRKT